jgi:uncharacterized RDD family membrane protein YckC
MSYVDQPPNSGIGDGFGGGVPTFTLAPWVKRVLAYLVDLIPALIIGFIGEAIGGSTGDIFAGVCGLGYAIGNYVIRQGSTGQTFGKSVLHLKLVKESNAQPTGPALALGRQVVHIVDYFPWVVPLYLGLLWPLWDPKRQTFADKICHTVVVEDAR